MPRYRPREREQNSKYGRCFVPSSQFWSCINQPSLGVETNQAVEQEQQLVAFLGDLSAVSPFTASH